MSEWISILEEEPKAGQGVLICFNNGAITVGYRRLKKNSHDWQVFGPLDKFGLKQGDYVTHWQHLPEPPNFVDDPRRQELYLYPSHYRNQDGGQ